MTVQASPEARTNQMLAFIDELEALYRKHGFYVASCGCCDGAWVEDGDPDEDEINSIKALRDKARGDYWPGRTQP